MSSLSSAALAQQIATAVSGDRGLNAPIFTDDLVRSYFFKYLTPPFDSAI
jgi:hypothetical protein